MNTHLLAWAAGVFDGEGYACSARYSSKTKGMTATLMLGVGQAHKEMLDRLLAIFRFGSVTGPSRSGNTPMWAFKIHGFEKVQAATAMLWPWLGVVKRAQLTRVLLDAKAHPTAKKRYFDIHSAAIIRTRLSNGERQSVLAKELACPKHVIWNIAHQRTYTPEEIRNVAD